MARAGRVSSPVGGPLTVPWVARRELLDLLQRQGFAPDCDGRPIVNVWSPRYLGGRPGDE